MIKKIPYKLLAVSTILALTTTAVVSPVTAFASEIEQTNNGDTSLSADEVKMKETFKKAGLFAQSMNKYSYMLIQNPNVNFEGITIDGYADLPEKIIQDQKNARAHAVTWDTKVKRQLLDTLTGIIEYNTTFDNYYETLVEAIHTGDGDTLKEGITDLRGEIQQNQKYAQQLIDELTQLRDGIGKDVRAFGSNKDLLHSVLKQQGADIEADQKRIDEILGEINRYESLESTLIKVMTVIAIPIFGIIVVAGNATDINKLSSSLAELRQTVDQKVTLNRVLHLAYNNINEMHTLLDGAINALTYMSTQWHDLDSQYSGVLGHIDRASGKADQNKFKFLKPNLNAAKDSWKTLQTDAVMLKEGIKELKVEPITPQE
ncbi:HBL/NHE enterotoxin family protein [Bacillus thuringiensis]|uniref:HBL/NHE enterotoxin family protein n=1 Tax=Bacillus thuringiensis TaxID=1428 RepID=UPI000E4D7022|nr:HBL/NHE enterotoxin family protein [Bacillus thuringiensis]MDZ3952374.1 HBL/NHE enterotoxin family protein [Bacillus thuringiensis]RGP45204.1 hemolysin [Bacillus thuringiensis]